MTQRHRRSNIGAYVIFDRDGTLIDHVHHLVNLQLVNLKTDLGPALQTLTLAGFKLGVITNQSVIGRRLGASDEVVRINELIEQHLKSFDVAFDFIYICPHLPEDECNCRKPQIALGLRAVLEFQLNPEHSFMVGDTESDMIFGRNLGCKTIQLKGGAEKSAFADYYSDTLDSAARWILTEIDRRIFEWGN